MKNPPFDSLVWGSLRLAPIIQGEEKQGNIEGVVILNGQSKCTDKAMLTVAG